MTIVNGKQVCKTPKTKPSYRSVSFPHFLAPHLKALQLAELQQRFQFGQDWQGEDWIFSQDSGKMMNYSTPYEAFQDAIRRYNNGKAPEQQLPLILFHGLRHPYVKPKTKKYRNIFEAFGAAESLPRPSIGRS